MYFFIFANCEPLTYIKRNINWLCNLLNAVAISIATYGCESWAMTKIDRKRVDAFEMWCYRRLLQTTWKDKRTNTWILKRIGTDLHLRSGIIKRKYRYFGHLVRRDGGIEKHILQGAAEGKRGKGCPSTSWTYDMKNCQEMVCMVHHALQWIELVGVLF